MTRNALAEMLADARHSAAHRLLAQRVVESGDPGEIELLVRALSGGPALVRTNAIKVLSEVAPIAPTLLTPHVSAVARAIDEGSGVVVWEGMAVLAGIATVHPDTIAPYLSTVRKAMAGPSVTARDRGVRILIALAADPIRHGEMMALLLDTVLSCPINQLPTYAEQVATIAVETDRSTLREALEMRLADVPSGAKHRRLTAVLKKLRRDLGRSWLGMHYNMVRPGDDIRGGARVVEWGRLLSG